MSDAKTDLDRRIEALLTKADRYAYPSVAPRNHGEELVRDLASVLRIVLQEQEDSEAAWGREYEKAECYESERDTLRERLSRVERLQEEWRLGIEALKGLRLCTDDAKAFIEGQLCAWQGMLDNLRTALSESTPASEIKEST